MPSQFATQSNKAKQSLMEFTPHQYQNQAIEFLLNNSKSGLFMDPGLGKTAISLSVIKSLKQNSKIFGKSLIIAPLLVAHNVWPEEIKKWNSFSDLKIHVLHGKGKRLSDDFIDVDIFVINPEGLPWLKENWKKLNMSGRIDTLIIDESSKFKHTSTKRFKLLRPLLPSFRRRHILTGSPASNGLMDLFGQIYVLDLGKSLGKYITHFRNNYFYPSGFGGYEWKLRDGADKQIYNKIAPLVLRMSAADNLDLPDLVENDIWLDLPDKVMKQYKELEDEMFLLLDEGTVTALSAGAASNKCRQVANGGLYIDEQDGNRRSVDLHTEKAQAVCNVIEEAGEGVLVLYDTHHDLSRLQREIKKITGTVPPHLGGGVPIDATKQIVKDWNAGKIPVLLGHPAAMGHGINLQQFGRHVVWHSLSWDLELYEQAVRRIYRQGVDGSVIVHHILARDTIDIAILKALRSKDKTQRALLNALKDYRLLL